MTVIKSPLDKRDYRFIQLSNELKVLLIHDVDCDKSAAALNVHVGSFSDPEHLMGLAHLCEHLSFMGTEKYPDENSYAKYLSEHGGSSNAYTSKQHTVYFFDVRHEHFAGAVDRFAQFFVAPLFRADCYDRELNAVTSEHEKNLQSDGWRLMELSRQSGDPSHPFCRFSTGNRKTLDIDPTSKGLDTREELLKFHDQYYSSNIMTLCLIGRETLDELEQLAQTHFSAIKNKSVSIPTRAGNPYGPAFVGKRLNVVPVGDLNTLRLSFPTDDILTQEMLRFQPLNYLSHLIGHEGPGSILSLLKAKGWANALGSGSGEQFRGGFAMFDVEIELTEVGFDHIDDIASIFFQYIQLLSGPTGVQRWIWEEDRDVHEMKFRFREKENPANFAVKLSENMHKYEEAKILTGGTLLEDYNEMLIREALKKLAPDNALIIVLSKKFQGSTDSVEPWYSTEFAKIDLSDEIRTAWTSAPISPELRLPLPNDMIATNFDIYPPPAKPVEFPCLLVDEKNLTVWHKQDFTFKLPSAITYWKFSSPVVGRSPEATVLLALFVDLISDSLNEFSYAATLGGLHLNVTNSNSAVVVEVNGYNHKLDLLLQKVMQRIADSNFDESRFIIIKEQLRRRLVNVETNQAYQHAYRHVFHVYAERAWLPAEQLSVLNDLTQADLTTFIASFFAAFHVESLVIGNMRETEAHHLVSIVRTHLIEATKPRSLLGSEKLSLRSVKLHRGVEYVRNVQLYLRENNATLCTFQLGSTSDDRLSALASLLAQIFHEPCYDVLRTKEQLGYIVSSQVHRIEGCLLFLVLVQSDRTPDQLDARIEAFMESFKDILATLPEEQFQKFVFAVVQQKLEKPKKLSKEANQQWKEINERTYEFDRLQREAEIVKNLTLNEVQRFYQSYILDAQRRRKLSVFVHRCKEGVKSEPDFAPILGVETIYDVARWQSKHSLLPRQFRRPSHAHM